MTPERWEKVKEVFEAALERAPEQRTAFLAEACAGNDSLAQEVQRLLAEHDRVGEFLDPAAWLKGAVLTPAFDPTLPTGDGQVTRTDTAADGLGVQVGVLKAGEIFADRYEIKGELGRGGFGIVYSAFDRGPLQRTVALKVIRFAPGEPAQPTVQACQRFLEEARVAGKLSHNNIATVYDVGEFGGSVYMTQELAPGRDLRKILAEAGPLPLRRIIAIGRQICEGLAQAHARNIVHRDIKPGNIVVGAEDRVKVTDFGLAQPPQGKDDTLDLAVAGTPGYMAPEQLRAERVDNRADIFAVGCVLYQMLTGRQPFEGATPASVIEKTLHAFPTDPSRVREDLPRTLDRIVGRALRKDPDERYNSITQLQQDLINYEQFEYLTEAKAGAAEIAAALEARQCTLFLGLHLPVSADQNHPSTAERLIAEYLAERLSSPPKERGLSRLAQELEMERGRPEMLKYLTAAVRNPRASPRELIRRVARLPFPVIVTTGYDTFLEDELAKVNRKVRRVINCRSVPDGRAEADLLVRLFGSVDSEASIVVTEDDLWNFFGSFHTLSDALKSLFARHRLLFVGYDPEEEAFRHLVSAIAPFRVETTEGCYLATSDTVLPTIRWAECKGLRLIDADPAAFLSLLEETITERRRQKNLSREQDSGSSPMIAGSYSEEEGRCTIVPGIQSITPSVPSAAKSDEELGVVVRRRKLWPLASTIVGLMLASALVFWLARPLPLPSVERYAQLTNDGRPKFNQVTDGVRLYFGERVGEHWILSQVSTAGGEVTSVPMPFKEAELAGISPDGSKLLIYTYTATVMDGEVPIWTLPLPSGQPRRIGDVLTTDSAWTPDGERILYVRGNEARLINSDGTGDRRFLTVPGAPGSFSWSPDARTLRFSVYDPNGSVSLWEASADGANPHPLFRGWNDPPSECCGSWVPGGSYFIFQSKGKIWATDEKGGFPRKASRKPVQLTSGPMQFRAGIPSRDGSKIFVIGTVRQGELVRYDADSHEFAPYLGGVSAEYIDFSKDGQWTTYVTYPEGSLWLSRVDGERRVQLTFSPSRAMLPRISPTGSQIAFMETGSRGHPKIFLVSTKGGGTPKPAMAGDLSEADPTWSPDGNSLIFGRAPWVEGDSPRANAIYRVDLRTGEVVMLPGSEGLFSPRWSPDGRYVAAMPTDHSKLVLYDFESRAWVTLATLSVNSPSWSRDGKYVFFETASMGASGESSVVRVRVSDHRVDQWARMKDFRLVYGSTISVGPDDSLLFLRDTGSQEIYALDAKFP